MACQTLVELEPKFRTVKKYLEELDITKQAFYSNLSRIKKSNFYEVERRVNEDKLVEIKIMEK